MVEKVYLDAFVYSASGNGSLALPLPLPLATKLHTPAPAPGLRSRAGARAPAREHHCLYIRILKVTLGYRIALSFFRLLGARKGNWYFFTQGTVTLML